MAKIELKGFLVFVGEPADVVAADGHTVMIADGSKAMRSQVIIVRVPAYVDEFGDKRGDDEYWNIPALNDKIEKFNLPVGVPVDTRVKVLAYINSRVWWKSDDIEKINPFYSVYATLGAIELLPKKVES